MSGELNRADRDFFSDEDGALLESPASPGPRRLTGLLIVAFGVFQLFAFAVMHQAFRKPPRMDLLAQIMCELLADFIGAVGMTSTALGAAWLLDIRSKALGSTIRFLGRKLAWGGAALFGGGAIIILAYAIRPELARPPK
jgi:hypothetical protein